MGRDTLDAGKRIMGFGHRVYRAEDPRSVILKRTARELGSPQIEVAERLEEAALAEPKAAPSRAPAEDERRVLLGARTRRRGDPRRRHPAMFACSRVAGWSAHILEQKRTGRLFRPSAAWAGAALAPAGVTLVEAAARADALAQAEDERAVAALRVEWDEEIEAAARDADYRVRAQGYRAIAQFRFRQKLELLRRGLEDDSPAARGSALIAGVPLARPPGRRQLVPPPPARARRARPNVAVRRLAVVCLRNGSPRPDTIQLLEGIAESEMRTRSSASRARRPGCAEEEATASEPARRGRRGLSLRLGGDGALCRDAEVARRPARGPRPVRARTPGRARVLRHRRRGARRAGLRRGRGRRRAPRRSGRVGDFRPVLGVPRNSSAASTRSCRPCRCRPGPVATLAIGRAEPDAALLAAAILARSDEELEARLRRYREEQADAVLVAGDPSA